MKLRNKKTGEIDDYEFVTPKEKGTIRLTNGKSPVEDIWEFDSLAELFNYFEDYKPKEPLIKDEKIRKAVRAWAEALEENTIRFDRVSQGFSFGNGNEYSSINFDGFVFDLVDGKKYTLDQLCGEEEK